MKRILIAFLVFIGSTGCCTYWNTPWVVYYYQTNRMVESLIPGEGYSIYEYTSPFVGVADNEEHLPAHYQILLPHQKNVKRLYSKNHDRCFVYSKYRGITIIQELNDKGGNYENGLYEISMDEAEGWISKVVEMHNTRIRVKDNRHHYIYVNGEIGIVMFNLFENDYHDFVEYPLNSFRLYRRGEIRLNEIIDTAKN